MTTSKGSLIKIGNGASGRTYEVLDTFPSDGGEGEVVIIHYEGVYVFARNTGVAGWQVEQPSAPLTDEQKAALRQFINASGTLDTTKVTVEKT